MLVYSERCGDKYMKRLLLVCAICGLSVVGCNKLPDSATQNGNRPTAGVSPTASPSAQASQRPGAATEKPSNNIQGDVTGAYFAAGSLPAEFSEIEHLSLATIDDRGNPAPLNGFIRPKRRSAQDYKLLNPTMNGKELTFTTATVDGVGYRFTGTFEKLGNFPENPPPTDEIVLRGTLTKTKDGNTVAETRVNFTYSAGG